MKAYTLKLKRNDLFCTYLLDDKITLVTDEKNPYPCTKTKWDNKTKQFSGLSTPPFNPDKMVYPTYAVHKTEFNDFLLCHVPPLIENALKFNNDNNLFFPIKEWDDIIELGMAGIKGYTDYNYEFVQNIVNRYLKLTPFW